MRLASDRDLLILGVVLVVVGSLSIDRFGIFGALIWLAGILLAVISGIHLIADKYNNREDRSK